MKTYLALASALVIGGSATFATTISPSFDTFDSLSAATFGGSGIPNNAVAQTTYQNSDDTVTLGLTATGRYSNPAVTGNGTGTFFATAGENDGLTSPGHALGATWNFDFYVNVAELPGASVRSYHTVLKYENNTTGTTGSFDFGNLGPGTVQDSQNLDFLPFALILGFDPNANAVYGFELDILNADSRVVASDAINVDVTGGRNVPDTASTAILLGCSFLGLAFLGRRQMRLAAK